MCACVPARKWALEGQESEQTSAPPLFVQVSWARGAGFPLGKHLAASEEHTESHHHDNHLDTHTHTPPFRARCAESTIAQVEKLESRKNSQTLTDAIFLVPVELLPRRTHTLIAALGVNTAMLTAPVADAALINVWDPSTESRTVSLGLYF